MYGGVVLAGDPDAPEEASTEIGVVTGALEVPGLAKVRRWLGLRDNGSRAS